MHTAAICSLFLLCLSVLLTPTHSDEDESSGQANLCQGEEVSMQLYYILHVYIYMYIHNIICIHAVCMLQTKMHADTSLLQGLYSAGKWSNHGCLFSNQLCVEYKEKIKANFKCVNRTCMRFIALPLMFRKTFITHKKDFGPTIVTTPGYTMLRPFFNYVSSQSLDARKY